MIRKCVAGLLLAVLALLAVEAVGAAPWGSKFIAKDLQEVTLDFEKDVQLIAIKAWSAPLIARARTDDYDPGVPDARSDTEPAWADGDTTITIAPGDWGYIRCDGRHIRHLTLITPNWYSTYDSNATAVTVEVE